jgi:shikimate dehydrogenase
MSLHAGLIDNAVRLETPLYAAIIGTTPSAGARSPTLWNAAFARAGVEGRMYPFDVSLENLPALVSALRADDRFVGGACAVPHKMALLPLLDEIEPEARKIGAVNCIYRRDNKLVGANTDGAGALPALAAVARGLAGKTAVLVGLGGAGRAVAVYVAGAVREIQLSNRHADAAKEVAALLANARIGSFPLTESLSRADIVINCTSLGSNLFPGRTALSAAEDPGVNLAESRDAIAFLPDSATVFDIVYQPSETPLLALAKARGLRTLNGEAMNLEQAVLAFGRAVRPNLTDEDVREAMRQAAS